VLGKRGAAEARSNVARLQRAGRDLPNDAPSDLVAAMLSDANTGLALAIVLVMTIKPGLAGSLAVLAIGVGLGAYQGRKHARGANAPAERSKAQAA